MDRSSETYRGFVYPWDMDHVGHMNVRFYVARFDEATWNFLAGLGITPGYLKENGRGMVAAEQNIKYFREVLSGSLLYVKSELVEVKQKVIKFKHSMFNGESHELVAEMVATGIHIDSEARKSCPFPEDIYGKIEASL